jgi:hypothetical protein
LDEMAKRFDEVYAQSGQPPGRGGSLRIRPDGITFPWGFNRRSVASRAYKARICRVRLLRGAHAAIVSVVRSLEIVLWLTL